MRKVGSVQTDLSCDPASWWALFKQTSPWSLVVANIPPHGLALVNRPTPLLSPRASRRCRCPAWHGVRRLRGVPRLRLRPRTRASRPHAASSAGEKPSFVRGRSGAVGFAPPPDLRPVAPSGRVLPVAALVTHSKRRLRSCGLVLVSTSRRIRTARVWTRPSTRPVCSRELGHHHYHRVGRLRAGFVPPDPAHPCAGFVPPGGAEDPRRGIKVTTARAGSVLDSFHQTLPTPVLD